MTKRKFFTISAITAASLIVVLLLIVLAWRVFTPSSFDDTTPANSHAPANVPAAEESPPPTKKFETDPGLQSEADLILPLFDNMPAVPVYLTDEPLLKTGSEKEKGVAYTVCTHKNPAIYVKKGFYRKRNQKQLINILKHEMTHAWFCRQGIQAAHDERFRRKFKEVGGFGN
jgi:hypothetical protein